MEGEALAQPRGNGGVHGGRHENSGTNHGPPINARSPSLHPLRHEVGRPSSSKAAVATLSSGTFSEPSIRSRYKAARASSISVIGVVSVTKMAIRISWIIGRVWSVEKLLLEAMRLHIVQIGRASCRERVWQSV